MGLPLSEVAHARVSSAYMGKEINLFTTENNTVPPVVGTALFPFGGY
jgi:hypothetical protein